MSPKRSRRCRASAARPPPQSAAIAYGRRAAILDGNVRRVLARYFGIEGPRGARATELELWQRAEACTPASARRHLHSGDHGFGGDPVHTPPAAVHVLPVEPRLRRASHRPRAGAARGARARRATAALGRDADRRARRRQRAAPAPRGAGRVGRALDAARVRKCSRGGSSSVPASSSVRGWMRRRCRTCSTRSRTLISRSRRCAHAAVRHGVEGAEVLWYNAREPARIGLPAPIATLLYSAREASMSRTVHCVLLKREAPGLERHAVSRPAGAAHLRECVQGRRGSAGARTRSC